ncbi:MAG: ABC transporter substrate-binding protein [Lachnospiraceae bacterium]
MMNQKVKQGFAIMLAAAMVISSAGCSGTGSGNDSGGNTAAENGSTSGGGGSTGKETVIHIGGDADPGSLAPWGVEGARNYPVAQLYETLIQLDVNKEVQYILASQIEQTDTYTYDITLYDYIHDTAGNPLNAHDVVFSFNMLADSGYMSQNLTSLESIEATGDYSVRIHLNESARAGAFELMLQKVRIVTEAAWEQSKDKMVTDPIGTMPYRLVEYVPGAYILFEKTDNYWQSDESLLTMFGKSNADKVYVDIIPERSTQAISLETGELDATQFISANDTGNFIDDSENAKDGYVQVVGYMSTTAAITFNCSSHSPFEDINLRKAVAYALDKKQLAYVDRGIDGVPVDYQNNPQATDFDPTYSNTAYSYNIEMAKEYLAKSDYNGEVLIGYASTSVSNDTVTMIMAQLETVGIKADLKIMEDAIGQVLHLDNSGTEYDFELWTLGTNGYSWTALSDFDLNKYDNGMSHIFIEDAKLQELYDNMAGIETNSSESTNAFMDYLVDECYRVPLFIVKKRIFGGAKIKTLVVDSWYQIVPGACEFN